MSVRKNHGKIVALCKKVALSIKGQKSMTDLQIHGITDL